MDGVQKIVDAAGKTVWAFTVGGRKYTCESWDGVIEILQEQKRINRENAKQAKNVGYGTGTYNGD